MGLAGARLGQEWGLALVAWGGQGRKLMAGGSGCR